MGAGLFTILTTLVRRRKMEERNLVKAHLLIHIHLSALLPGGAAGRPSANYFSDQGSIPFLAKHFFCNVGFNGKNLCVIFLTFSYFIHASFCVISSHFEASRKDEMVIHSLTSYQCLHKASPIPSPSSTPSNQHDRSSFPSR